MFLPNVAAESGVEGSAKALLITGGVLLFVCLVAMMIYWGKSRKQVVWNVLNFYSRVGCFRERKGRRSRT